MPRWHQIQNEKDRDDTIVLIAMVLVYAVAIGGAIYGAAVH